MHSSKLGVLGVDGGGGVGGTGVRLPLVGVDAPTLSLLLRSRDDFLLFFSAGGGASVADGVATVVVVTDSASAGASDVDTAGELDISSTGRGRFLFLFLLLDKPALSLCNCSPCNTHQNTVIIHTFTMLHTQLKCACVTQAAECCTCSTCV